MSGKKKRRRGAPGVRVPDNIRAQIVAKYATGRYTQDELGRRYGLSGYSVSRIIKKAMRWDEGDQRRIRKGRIQGERCKKCPHCGLPIREGLRTWAPISAELAGAA